MLCWYPAQTGSSFHCKVLIYGRPRNERHLQKPLNRVVLQGKESIVQGQGDKTAGKRKGNYKAKNTSDLFWV